MKLTKGDKIFHRRADLFGTIETMEDDDTACVRYDWPHDGVTTVRVPLRELISAYDVPSY